MMDAREQRGRAIAETQQLVQKGRVWIVPSQSGDGKSYKVFPDGTEPHCTCPDHENGFKCKHIFAVEFTLTRTTQEVALDGTVTTTTESVTVKTTAERKTYKQSWPEYNAAQVNERDHFHELLADLCSTLPEPPRKPGRGRKPVSYRDGLFSAILKVYSLTSARRFSGELQEAFERGYIEKLPHFNTVLGVLENEDVTPLLKGMIEASALPLKAIETDFAVDSTGFSTQKYLSWFDHKYNAPRTSAKWVKAHFATGVKTNVVTAVNIDHQDAGDSPQFGPLVKKTAQEFSIGEVSADKAYGSLENFETVEACGGKFFPQFKANATGGVGGAFQKAFHYFSFKRDEYLTHYHKRSNVESTVSMIKRKFGDSVKAKNDTAQKNEVYAKFVCHNICVLIMEMYVQGIDPSLCVKRQGRQEQPAMQILKFPAI